MIASAKTPNTRVSAPIGIFDSGVGGLTVAHEIMRLLPHESVIYFADTKNVPYGNKGNNEVAALTNQATQWLAAQGCKCVVVACNTASAHSLTNLRELYSALPIIGLVPAVKPACQLTRSKVIGVLATEGTLRGALLQEVIAQFAQPAGISVHTITHAQLVPLIEAGQAMSAQCAVLLTSLLDPYVARQMDCLVLGCTHYPLLRPLLAKLYPQLQLLDSGHAIAQRTQAVLAQRNLLANQAMPTLTLHCTGNVASFKQSLKAIPPLPGKFFDLEQHVKAAP